MKNLIMAAAATMVLVGCADNASTMATPPGNRNTVGGTTGNSASTTVGGTGGAHNTAGGTAADPYSQQQTGTGAVTTTGGPANTKGSPGGTGNGTVP